MEVFSSSNASSFIILVITLITIVVGNFLWKLYVQQVYWKKRNIPFIKPMLIFGSGWRVFFRRTDFPTYCKFVYNYDPDTKYIGIMDFATPTVVIRDPEIIKDIAVKNFEQFPDHRAFVDEQMDPIFGKNVFSLRGERWKEMRTTLSPSFTTSKMRFMFELVSKCSHEFVDYLYDHPEFSSSIEAKDAFTRYTNDVIATAAFGISVNSLKDKENEFFVRGTEASKFGSALQLIKFMLFRLSPRLTRKLGFTFLSRESSNFFTTVVSETVKAREEQGIVRPDMIHLLMQARDTEKYKMTIDDIVAQAFIFFLAGFDTSSTLMCWLIHELAINPDIQEKLREEVDRYMAEGNGEITYEALSKMEYMEMVISETLRKYPPVIFIDRVCVEDFNLPPPAPGYSAVTIKKNNVAWFPVYGLHHDPNYFPNPEKFDPERFNEENKGKINPYVYMPFGLGPRKCIGNRFALMETKILIAHLLQKFILKPTPKTKKSLSFSRKSFTLIAEGGFWVGLEKRKT